MNPRLLLSAVSALILPLSAADTIELADCPPAVRATIDANLQGGTLEDIEQDTRKDAIVYDADVVLGENDVLELRIAEDGTLQETRRKIELDAAPEAVAAAVRGLGGQFESLREIHWGDQVRYRAVVVAENGDKANVEFADDGTELNRKVRPAGPAAEGEAAKG